METRTTGRIDPTINKITISDQIMAIPTPLSETTQITPTTIDLHTKTDNSNNLLQRCNKDNDQMETITGNILNVRMIHDLRTMIDDNKHLIFALTTWQTSKMTSKQSHNFLRKTKTNDLRKDHFRSKVFNSREYSTSANYFTARLFTWHFITNQPHRRRYLATIERIADLHRAHPRRASLRLV